MDEPVEALPVCSAGHLAPGEANEVPLRADGAEAREGPMRLAVEESFDRVEGLVDFRVNPVVGQHAIHDLLLFRGEGAGAKEDGGLRC